MAGPDECWLFLVESDWGEYKGFWTGVKFDGAHRYALELKIGRLLRKGECALHTCDNKSCVNPAHLFPGSNDDNSKDMVRKGRKERGAAVYGAKLTDEKVLQIRQRYATGETANEIAPDFGITTDNVLFVVRGATWKHVAGPLGTRKRGARGIAVGTAVLNERKVRYIRKWGRLKTAVQIGHDVGASPETVRDVLKGRTWVWVV